MGFMKPCLDCGGLSRHNRCDNCAAARSRIQNRLRDTPDRRAKKSMYYNKEYQRRAKHIRATAVICHLCGKGANPNDPWQADHVTPGDSNSALLPAHRSCNASRGDKPLGGGTYGEWVQKS